MAERDVELRAAQEALVAHYAPDTRIARLRWSGGETQAFELGSGSPLLLVHGGGDAAYEWIPVLPALAERHRVIAVDRPGHGLADPFDYRAVDLAEHAVTFLTEILDALELESVAVVANSIGGWWAAVLALDRPERVERLVLAGHPPGVTRDAPLPLRILGAPVIGNPLGRFLMRNPTRDGQRKFWGEVLVAHPERLSDALLDVDVAHTRRNRDCMLGLIRLVVGLRGVRREVLLGERWRQLRAPTVFVHGDRDAFLTQDVVAAWEAIAAENANVRIVRIADAGHLPWIDEPEAVVSAIEQHLEVPE